MKHFLILYCSSLFKDLLLLLKFAWGFQSIEQKVSRENYNLYTLKNQRLKITLLKKASFIKVNELKLSQVELFKFFHFLCVAANATKLFYMVYLANIEHFISFELFILNIKFYITCKLASLSWWKSTQVREGEFYLWNA